MVPPLFRLVCIVALAVASTDAATSAAKSGKTKPAATSTGKSAPAKKPVAKKPAPAEESDNEPKPPKPSEPADTAPAKAKEPPAPPKKEHAPSASLEPADLLEFAAQPPRVQQLIAEALALTKLDLTYTYGSADPARGGMDCSGAIYHTLRAQGFAGVPRDSSEQYVWVRKAGGFQAVVGISADTFELDALRPGDLMFWSGTYSVTRDFPVTHVMLYLGREKKTKQRVMFGASDGRSYRGVQRWGVSVFDFKMPKADSGKETRVDFLGYGPIPGLRGNDGEVAVADAPKPDAEPEKAPPPETPAAKKPAASEKPKIKSTGKKSGSSATKRKAS